MKLRIGMNQQQYQRIEAGGNPRLETLELIAEGLEADILLSPHDKLLAVYAVLQDLPRTPGYYVGEPKPVYGEPKSVDFDPWAGILDKA